MKNKFTSLIVEDDPLIVTQLGGFLAQTELFEKPYVSENCTHALNQLHEHSVDLLFLDIQLPDMNGLEFLRSFPHHCPTVVISAYPKYAVECFDHDVSDFLEKPLNYLRFLRSLRRTVLQGGDTPNSATLPSDPTEPPTDPKVSSSTHIYLKNGHTKQRFDFADILYLEASNIYTKVITDGGITVVSEAISTMEECLGQHRFIRVHKSYMVNLARVSRYSSKTIWLQKTTVPIGRKYQKDVKNSFERIVERAPVAQQNRV